MSSGFGRRTRYLRDAELEAVAGGKGSMITVRKSMDKSSPLL
jgi:hypothetical protein